MLAGLFLLHCFVADKFQAGLLNAPDMEFLLQRLAPLPQLGFLLLDLGQFNFGVLSSLALRCLGGPFLGSFFTLSVFLRLLGRLSVLGGDLGHGRCVRLGFVGSGLAMRTLQHLSGPGEGRGDGIGVLGDRREPLREYRRLGTPGFCRRLHRRRGDDQIVKTDMGFEDFQGTRHGRFTFEGPIPYCCHPAPVRPWPLHHRLWAERL